MYKPDKLQKEIASMKTKLSDLRKGWNSLKNKRPERDVAPSDELKWRSRDVGSQCNLVLPSDAVVWKPNSKSNIGKQCPQSAPAAEILDAYPKLEKEDISQALRYAAFGFLQKRQNLFR